MIPILVGAMCVFSRLAGLFMVLPGIGGSGVPMLARVGFALPLTIVLLPAYGTAHVPLTVAGLLGTVTVEALVGVATGTVVSFVFGSVGMAADLIGGQMGLQAAAMIDPISGVNNGTMGSLVTWVATGLFFGSDRHLACVVALGRSFQVLPVGDALHFWRAGGVIFEVATASLVAGVQLAGPLILFVSMVNLGLALLGRMAPNLNLFFGIGHTLTVVAGVVLVSQTFPTLLVTWMQFVDAVGFGRLLDLWRSLG